MWESVDRGNRRSPSSYGGHTSELLRRVPSRIGWSLHPGHQLAFPSRKLMRLARLFVLGAAVLLIYYVVTTRHNPTKPPHPSSADRHDGRETQGQTLSLDSDQPVLRQPFRFRPKPNFPSLGIVIDSPISHKPDLVESEFDTQTQSHVNKHPQLQLQTTSPSLVPEYVEVFWNKSLPRPQQISIVPGKRTDPARLGEFGVPVKIEPETLSPGERAKWNAGWKTHEFNQYVSDLISVEREIPTYKPKECPDTTLTTHLPAVSIIMCFHNEAWSVFQRSIHSVLRNSPPELVSEIILVDDFSELKELHEPLEFLVAKIEKVRLLRMKRRSGVVLSRLAGIEASRAPILVFLDSHVECEKGWLPPLVQTLQRHPRTAVTPVINIIDENNFSVYAGTVSVGILHFDMSFDWAEIPDRISRTRTSPADPFSSPAMAGGLFAIWKDYFLSIGTYDRELRIWGGENSELSMKLWMCGDGIFIHPCSQVAHVFRSNSPYLKGKMLKLLDDNLDRVAQGWLDDYRVYYFDYKRYNQTLLGSVDGIIELRKKLKCKSFSWYLENVIPEMYVPGAGEFLGQIENGNGMCLHASITPNRPSILTLRDCGSKLTIWESTRIKEIRFYRTVSCLAVKMYQNMVPVLLECGRLKGEDTFDYLQNTFIYHLRTNSCLTASERSNFLTFQPCTGHLLQTWNWPRGMDTPTSPTSSRVGLRLPATLLI